MAESSHCLCFPDLSWSCMRLQNVSSLLAHVNSPWHLKSWLALGRLETPAWSPPFQITTLQVYGNCLVLYSYALPCRCWCSLCPTKPEGHCVVRTLRTPNELVSGLVTVEMTQSNLHTIRELVSGSPSSLPLQCQSTHSAVALVSDCWTQVGVEIQPFLTYRELGPIVLR